MKLNLFSFIIVTLMALIGTIVSANAVHEYIHYSNLNRFNVGEDHLCLLNIKGESAGYYQFEVYANESKEPKKIAQVSEVKGYVVTSVILLIGGSSILIFFYNYLEGKYINDQTRRLETLLQ